jgi:hypothetical protein
LAEVILDESIHDVHRRPLTLAMTAKTGQDGVRTSEPVTSSSRHPDRSWRSLRA